eukprot:3781521-Rhodomonas_salina.11
MSQSSLRAAMVCAEVPCAAVIYGMNGPPCLWSGALFRNFVYPKLTTGLVCARQSTKHAHQHSQSLLLHPSRSICDA